MEKVSITGVDKCDGDGTTLRLSVRGCEVMAFFPQEGNQQAFAQIRKALVDTCISNFCGTEMQKIGQNVESMR